MSVLVVAYPTLSPSDYSWIQAFRVQHDSHHTLIAPHFTVVFPTSACEPAALVDHVVSCTRAISRFPFVLRCATTVKDAFSPKTHLFLVPDEGYSLLVKLHDALYTKMLASQLRLDVPYIPHITIGDHHDPHMLYAFAQRINGQNINIHGQIMALDVIVYTNNTIQTAATVQLA